MSERLFWQGGARSVAKNKGAQQGEEAGFNQFQRSALGSSSKAGCSRWKREAVSLWLIIVVFDPGCLSWSCLVVKLNQKARLPALLSDHGGAMEFLRVLLALSCLIEVEWDAVVGFLSELHSNVDATGVRRAIAIVFEEK